MDSESTIVDLKTATVLRDALTGLRTTHELAKNAPKNASAALWIDIDGLIYMNHMFGWKVTDRTLLSVANALSQTLEPVGGTLYRAGGDEFLVIFERMAMPTALDWGRKVIDAIDQLAIPYKRGEQSEQTKLQVNVVVFELHPKMLVHDSGRCVLSETIRRKVEDAIYEAKLDQGGIPGVVALIY